MKSISNALNHGLPCVHEKISTYTAITLSSGATMLTSLEHEAALQLISSCGRTGKGRIYQKPDGDIAIRDSVWLEYGDTHTDLHDINPLIRIKDRIASLYNHGVEDVDTLVIVDWGCGAGHTLVQIDSWLRSEKNACVQLYGFANEMHPDWQDAPDTITFILDVAGNLPNYFNNRAVDFIYSIAGLYYLFLPEFDCLDCDMVEYFKQHHFDGRLFKYYDHTEKHLSQLTAMMKLNRELMIDLPIHVIDIDFDVLKSGSPNFKAIRNPEKYGEHAYVLVPTQSTSPGKIQGIQISS